MNASGGMFRCEYSGTTKGPRYEMWREEFARRWVSADFEPVAGDQIDSEIKFSEHAFLGLCIMSSGAPIRMVRRNDLLLNARSYMYLLIASGSPLQALQRGRSIDLSPGQMTLVSADEPAQVTQLGAGGRFSIRIPQRLLMDFCRDAEDKITRPIACSGEVARLILHQIETAHRFGPKLDVVANHALAQHLLDLVGLCLGAGGDLAHLARQNGLAAVRLDAIKADILRRLGDCDVGLRDIAAKHGVSTRYVQHLFEQSGVSFTGFVLERRLQLARRLLGEPKNRWRKISDIAAAAGFSDISYFNRAFKARYGATPREVRGES